ncbi:MAG: hypothetical protein ACREXS_02450 [Gammaproteobacteria bacterium]
MTTVTLDLPDDVFSALRRSPQDFGREMRLAAAVHWHQPLCPAAVATEIRQYDPDDSAVQTLEKLWEAKPDTARERPLGAPLHPRRSVRAGALSYPAARSDRGHRALHGKPRAHRKDLEPFIGSRARVSEVMARRRPLTLSMIRRLTLGLGIPTDAVIQPYRTVDHRQLDRQISILASGSSFAASPGRFRL